MPREIRRDVKFRAAAAEQKRLRRAQLTDEERQEVKAREAERVRQRRAQMTEEDLEKRRARDAQKKREKRSALKSEEELQPIKSKKAQYTFQQTVQMTEAELKGHTIENGAQLPENGLQFKSEALQKLQKIRERDAELKRQKRATMNEEEREKRSVQAAERMRRKKAQMTKEELKKLNAQKTEYNRQRKARWTEEEWQRFKAMQAARRRLKENGTAVEKIRHMTSMVVELSKRHPARYEIVGTEFKNSLSEILNLYTEVAALRKNFKKTISEAVQNVVGVHRIEKQLKAVGCQSVTFVELPPPSDLGCTIKQEFNEGENETETDPFLVPPDAQPESLHPQNENPAKELANETLQIFSHDEFAASDRNSDDETNKVKKFECSICSKKFATSLGLTIHQKKHQTNSGEFKCSLCPQMFNDCNLMTTHYLQLHSLEFDANAISIEAEAEEPDEVLERHRHEFEFLLLRKCLICFQTFDVKSLRLSTYSHHIISDHSDNKELLKYFTYICARCDRPHAVQRSLENHWETFCFEKWKNEELNNQGIVCEKCGMKFSNNKSLSSHAKLFHIENKKVTCEQCGKELRGGLVHLKMHIKAVHEGEYKFTCEQCGKSFKLRQSLLNHMESIHLGVLKPFACKFCSRQFARRGALTVHENCHTGGEKPYKCKYCDKTFAGRSGLDEHVIKHKQTNNNLQLTCEICGKTLTTSKAMHTHKRSVHGERQNCACDICGRIFKSNASLKDHKYTHDGLKRFGCSLCERTFQKKTNFYHHRKSHTNENAKLVKLIYEKETPSNVFPDIVLHPTYNVTTIITNPSEKPKFNASILALKEPQDSPKVCFSELNKAKNSTYSSNSVIGSNPEELHSVLPTFIDFSRANVPLGTAALSDDACNAKMEIPQTVLQHTEETSEINEQQYKVEDSAEESEEYFENSLLPDIGMEDLPKIKVEALDEAPYISDSNQFDSNDEVSDFGKEAKVHHTRSKTRLGNVKLNKKRKHTRKIDERKPMKSFDCLYCEVKNLWSAQMIAHCSEQHPGKEPLKCKMCPKMFFNMKAYWNHKTRIHTYAAEKSKREPNAKKEILCEICGKAFYTKPVMWTHRTTMHRKDINVECDICHKMIRGRGNLKLHKNRHLGIKPHLCEECGMAFVLPHELKEHVRVKHRGEKKRPKIIQTNKTHPFSCTLCPCRFVQEVGLQKHLPLHDPHRKYECHHCRLRFNCYNTLFCHRKTMHKNIKPKRKPRTASADV